MHTVSTPATDERGHLSSEASDETGKHFSHCLAVQHPLPRLELLSRQKACCDVQVPWNMNCSQRRKPVLSPKEEAAHKSVEGARPRASLAIYMGHHCHVVRPDNDMTAHQGQEKIIQSQRDGSQFEAIYVPREKLACPNTTRGLPSKTAPQPVREASVVTTW
ncbi:hypothetical protein PO909_015266 [Leuciscus waleckii]